MLAHERAGAGEPLLLIHGLGGSRRIWRPLLGRLGARHETIAIDLPGFGGSAPLAPGVEPSAANLAAAVAGLCAELGLQRPHVAGNSLGGWVGLELGRRGGAASVTALSPAGLWRRPLGARRFDSQLWARRLRPAVALALRTRRGRERMLATFAARPELIPAGEGRALVLDWIDSPGYEDANRAMRADVFDPRGYPPIPVTLAWGDRDRLVGPPRPERRPDGARFVVLEGAGHTPTWDDPALVATTLLKGAAR